MPHAGGLNKVLSTEEPQPRFVFYSGSDGIERAKTSRSLEVNSSIGKNSLLILIGGGTEPFYRYKSGRWLWEEPAQLSSRYVQFNVAELAQIAARSIGASSCVEIEKLPEGNFNKTFLLTMDDGNEVIAKVPNPNSGRPHFTTASEVATMDFVRNSSLICSAVVINITLAGKKRS